jgi:hypothetical protein
MIAKNPIRVSACLLFLAVCGGLPSGVLTSRATAAGAFDGTYTGSVVPKDSNPNCTWHLSGGRVGTVTDSITVTNNHFEHPIHDVPMSVNIAADGGFQASGNLQVPRQIIPQHLVGKIEGGVMTAQVTTNANACAFDLTLRKQ